jgi:hypothetical protein
MLEDESQRIETPLQALSVIELSFETLNSIYLEILGSMQS